MGVGEGVNVCVGSGVCVGVLVSFGVAPDPQAVRTRKRVMMRLKAIRRVIKRVDLTDFQQATITKDSTFARAIIGETGRA